MRTRMILRTKYGTFTAYHTPRPNDTEAQTKDAVLRMLRWVIRKAAAQQIRANVPTPPINGRLKCKSMP